ncbi:hypothetical protein [Acinetobacter soli]|uniref:hypothetical protein n=1 Tax=Acinetobacter soli TaxID=487316 RepID=UPI00124CEB7B|nr:hypothetical protein [Acinetobacter soli]
MITAQQAAEMAGPKAEEYLAFIEKKIVESAKNQEHEVIIRDTPYCDWLYGSNKSNPDEVKKTLKVLSDNGFKVSLHYQENQFVDIGLKVEW